MMSMFFPLFFYSDDCEQRGWLQYSLPSKGTVILFLLLYYKINPEQNAPPAKLCPDGTLRRWLTKMWR